jgi:hypothetical protein
VLGLSLAVLSERAADIHYLVKPAFFVPAHIPLVSPVSMSSRLPVAMAVTSSLAFRDLNG